MAEEKEHGDDFMGVYYILEDYADTVEKMIDVTHASEDAVVRGFEGLESRGLINAIRRDGKIESVKVTEKGFELYSKGY
ncbi:hypothetical protein J4402_03785 [Candidatus Pacearchaeota archaeon]|nr:hypothetical protein [Candidatus Pacearchaeota archaeon]